MDFLLVAYAKIPQFILHFYASTVKYLQPVKKIQLVVYINDYDLHHTFRYLDCTKYDLCWT